MKLHKVKTPANDYVVTVRNGQRLSKDDALTKRLMDNGLAEEADIELLESMGLVTKIPWPDPAPD